MATLRARAPSRTAILLIVAGAHFLVLEVISRARSPANGATEGFVTTAFFIPDVPRVSSATGQPAPSSRRTKTRAAVAQAALPQSNDSSTAITPTPPPHKVIDWSAQIPSAAATVMAEEEVAQRQSTWLMRKFVLAADPSQATARMPTRFRWSNTDADHDGTRNWLSTLHLDEHCVLLGFVIPDCAIERLPAPANFLEYIRQKHDATLVTPGPNDIPP
jgi:hypothetical protein